jgi:hypothetical protein
MIKVIETEGGETLFDFWNKALKTCETGHKISNLILSGFFPFSETNSDWINNYKDKAKEWQKPERPNHLVLNHGEYIDKYKSKFNKSGLNYIVDELKTKADSNRACWSLYDMSTLIDSGDKPIPSFMVLQVGISDDSKTLLITTYYRALELSKFLPINIAESCLIAEKLQNEFSYKFTHFSLTIHAFNGYVKENFSCLEKASIDLLSESEIMMNIMTANTSKEWLKEKLSNKKETNESRINPDGIEQLIKCIEMYNRQVKAINSIVYEADLLKYLKSILNKIKEYNEIVNTSTYAAQGKNKYQEILKEIDKAINSL